MIILGITGSVGMGKSTLCNLLRDRDIPVHDADETAHRLLNSDPYTIKQVGAIFPNSLTTHKSNSPFIDRTILSAVLKDKNNLQKLENILHPLIFADAENFKNRMREQNHPFIALDIPLLFETQSEDKVDVIICISAPPALQKSRVMARPHMTEEKFAHILANQMPDAEKRKRAHYTIDNDGDIGHLNQQLDHILNILRLKTNKDL
jgi:dephospho-CoA kinase